MILRETTSLTNEILHNRIKKELEQAKNVVIMGHIRPDGDAIGSLLGLAQALRERGKTVKTVLQDPADSKFDHLPGADRIHSRISGEFDYLITVDSADRKRIGSVLPETSTPDLVIDHHVSHIDYGEIDFVEADFEATALVLYEFMPKWGLEISIESAKCLMTGILSDTIGFRTSDTSSKSLRAVAEMMDMGVDLAKIYFQTLSSRSINELRYWAQGLGKINFKDGIVWTSLSFEDRKKSGYKQNDDADLVNHLSAMQGASMAVIFTEQANEMVKISWRSGPGIDVSVLANQFGGGGHAAAAGADVSGKLPEVIDRVLAQTKVYLNK